MRRPTRNALILWIALLALPSEAAADAGACRLAPPNREGPVVVRAAFELRDVTEIDDVTETFDFTGALTLAWTDPRQAFDAAPGAEEKVYQGNYQFNELSPGWYPQVVLLNESGEVTQNGVVLRVRPDGGSTLIQTITASVETELDMRWFPFDAHRLEAEFAVLGFDRDEVRLEVAPTGDASLLSRDVKIPQWSVTTAHTSVEDRSAAYPGRPGASSTFVVRVDVARESFYVRRLVTLPLSVIVLLSFSVFWMDRSSLGDRISVSFIGILTGVTYQLVRWDVLPHISYFTLIHGFLFLGFATMCATVVVNLVVGAADKAGDFVRGDRIDRRCRWIFPLAYFGSIAALFAGASAFF
jgi:hypothetical protein